MHQTLKTILSMANDHQRLYSVTVNNDQLGDNHTKSYRNSNEGIKRFTLYNLLKRRSALDRLYNGTEIAMHYVSLCLLLSRWIPRPYRCI